MAKCPPLTACQPNAMYAKFRIAELLGLRVNSVERFKDLAGL